jgi:glycosyltransferase involved in cell wall biosynthesis
VKIVFVTTFCPHYRQKTFELLAHYQDVDYYFFSTGGEWYWQQEHGVEIGDFHYEYLPGFRLGRTKVTLTLPWKLWRGEYSVYIKCINGRFALPITYIVARLKRKPFILWTGIWKRLQTPAHRLFFPLTRYIYRHADAIVVYGEHVKQYLISEGALSRRIYVAAHAVDNDIYYRTISIKDKGAMRRKLDITAGQKIVLYLGRLEKVKGLPYLIEAFALLQEDDSVLVIVGTGSEETQLRCLAEKKGLTGKVRFVGYVPPQETVFYYALASVCVLPSISTSYCKESWGLVVNEAFCQGVPVIATESVGAATGGLVLDGVNGLVVPERDCFALTQALQRILGDSNFRKRLEQNARRIIANWDNQRMVMGFREALNNLSSTNNA